MSSGKKNLAESYYDIRILRNGTWLYQNSPITRHNMVKLFASVLQRDDAGAYWLVTPYERGQIVVDDAPFTAVEMKYEANILSLRTNMDVWVNAGAENPLRVAFHPKTGEPSPYVLVKPGLEALLLRPVYYEMVGLAVKEKGVFGLWSQNVFFPLEKD